MLEDKCQVSVGMPGRRYRPHGHRRRHLDTVTIAKRLALEGDGVIGIDVVTGFTEPGEGIAAGQVVIVDMRLENVGDLHSVLLGRGEGPVDVALGVDHERHGPVVDQVAAVPQGGGGDDQYLVHVPFLLLGQHIPPGVK